MESSQYSVILENTPLNLCCSLKHLQLTTNSDLKYLAHKVPAIAVASQHPEPNVA